MSDKYIIEDHHLDRPKKMGDIVRAFCPFHDDKNTPNLTVFKERTRFKCFSCGRGGNAYNFLKERGLLPNKPKKSDTPKKSGRPSNAPTEADVEKAHKALLKNEKAVDYLKTHRKWNKTTIKNFKLGLKNNYITIPIYSRDNILLNIRLYDVAKKGNAKFMSWAKGMGTRMDLFPANALTGDFILLCEGEPDTILAQQLGFNAAAFTGGAGSLKPDNLSALLDKKIAVIFDVDDVGVKAANKVVRFLSRICPEVKNVKLPIEEPENGDLTDYIKQGATADDLKKLIDNTDLYVPSVKERERIAKMEPVDMNLEDASMAVNASVKQRFIAIVAGKDTEPYLIPKRVKVFCQSATTVKLCNVCGLIDTGSVEIDIGPYDPEILQVVGCSQFQARGVYRRMADIPSKCTSWGAETLSSQNVEDLMLIPDINFESDIGRPYVSRRAILVDGIAETNRPYRFTGHTTPHPATHHVVHLAQQAEPTVSAIENFNLTKDVMDQLQIFKPEKGQGILDKIEEIHTDLSENVTFIYGRNDMLMAFDLAYHSALRFKFQNKDVRRGWVETLILGDTRCGKSDTAFAIQSHFRAGEMVGAENLSYAGLVGGINIVGNRKMIAWGKLPLNDGGLVILDEFSGMRTEEIERLSGIRASGVAEITKIQTEKTMSRVRLVIMSNPRKNLTVSEYSMGIHAVRDLIGKAEDIARFDFVVTLASDEIKPEQINQLKRSEVTHKYNRDACSNRVRWIWSRQPEQVIFTNDAEKLVLWSATELAKKFHASIPLVEPSEQRIKLARISVAIAGMVFSTKTGDEIIVNDKHIEAAYNVLVASFVKKSMGYDIYSNHQFKQNTIDNELEVKQKVRALGANSVGEMLGKGYIQLNDAEDWVNGDRQDAKELLSFLRKNRALRKPNTTYRKTPRFTQLLIEIQKELENGN